MFDLYASDTYNNMLQATRVGRMKATTSSTTTNKNKQKKDY